jgi:outer membrane protein assembly factor BamD
MRHSRFRLIAAVGGLLALAGCATCKDPLAADAPRILGVEAKQLDKVLDQTEDKVEKNYEPMMILQRAEAYFRREEPIEAQAEYQRFLDLHPLHPLADYAQYKLAMSSYCQIRTIDRDPEPAEKALTAFQKLLSNYPKTAYADTAREKIGEIQEGLARHEVYVGRFYYRKGAYPAAIARLQRVVEQHPGEPVSADALLVLVAALKAAGEDAKAEAALERLLTDFPDMRNDPQVEKLRRELKTTES